jgi:hypothetical protein
MGAHVLPPFAVKNFVKSNPEGKVDLLPLLGFVPATFGIQKHCSDHSAKPTPNIPAL